MMNTATDDLIARIRSADDLVRSTASREAAARGAPAVKPLAALLADREADANPEAARSAKGSLYRIVRDAGRPGAEAEAKAVTAELLALLKSDAPRVRREALWLLSEIGTEEAAAPMVDLLADPEVREDARCALTRLPGAAVAAMLKTAFHKAPEDFKPALAEALRERGEAVTGYPSERLVPKRTTVISQPG